MGNSGYSTVNNPLAVVIDMAVHYNNPDLIPYYQELLKYPLYRPPCHLDVNATVSFDV
jgi:hypothetical protein